VPRADGFTEVNSSVDFQRFVPVVAVAAVAVVAVALVVRGVGGSHSGTANTQQVLQDTIAGGKGARSGKFAATLTVALQGVPAQAAKPVSAKLSGAFDRTKTGQPQFELDGNVAAAGQSFPFGLLSKGERAFVTFRGTTYALPAGRLEAGAGATSPLASLGVNPQSWFTNVRDAGKAEVGGVSVTHLRADFDAGRAFADIQQAAAKSGQAGEIPQSAQKTISDAVKDAKVDVYTGESDHVLRKLAVAGQFEGTGPTGGQALRGTVNFDLQVNDVNRPQEIRAPGHAVPISRLGSALGASGLTLGSTGGGKTSAPARSRGDKHRKGPSKSNPSRRQRSSQAYVACVQQAQDIPALDKCQALLP
jgi:hypothetical protein